MNAKTNTFRVLAGQRPLITSIFCYIDRHTWTQWSDPAKLPDGFFHKQHRHCIHCNKWETL